MKSSFPDLRSLKPRVALMATKMPLPARRATYRAWLLVKGGQHHALLKLAKGQSQGTPLETYMRHGCIFVHIPKTAGQSVSVGLFGGLASTHFPIWKYQLLFSDFMFADLFKFAFVRNPWDRCLSAYRYVQGQWPVSVGDDALPKVYKSFDSFVTEWLSRGRCFSVAAFTPQSYFLTINGKVVIDYLGRFERLAEDFEYVRSHLKINAHLPHVNSTNTSAIPYREFYSSRARRIVEDVYSDDIALFHYSF